jgi:hypothetical protein
MICDLYSFLQGRCMCSWSADPVVLFLVEMNIVRAELEMTGLQCGRIELGLFLFRLDNSEQILVLVVVRHRGHTVA